MQRRNMLRSLGLLSAGLGLGTETLAKTTVSTRSALRIAHITDVHIQHLLGAARGFERCLHHLQNLERKPDFIFNGGDAIMGLKQASLRQNEKQFGLFHEVLLSENSLPVYHCIGNHDIWHSDKADFNSEKLRTQDLAGLQKPYYSLSKKGWHFIVLDSVQSDHSKKNYVGRLDEEQLHWLQNELKSVSPETPVCLLSHIPILSACVFFDGKNYKGQTWQLSGSWMHSDASELTELFYQYPNVKLALSGHIHLLDKVVYNKVTYCCNGAVSGAWWMGNYKQTAPGYALIDLFEDGTFEVNYQSYEIRKTG